METQDGQLHVLLTAQRDLARLSQQIGASNVPGQSATGLLELLRNISGAQHGAILLANQRLASTLWTAPVKAWNVFALSNMIEEDALTLLSTLSPTTSDIQTRADRPFWLFWRVPLSPPLSDTAEQTTALVVLGWPDHAGKHGFSTSLEHKNAILLELKESVRAVIANILLAERVYELETVRQRKALREMELLKAELLATVSHELRSPLASIKGYAATLLRHDRRISREERHEFLLAINESSDRLATVIDRLLEMSQLDTDSVALQCVPINLAHLIREALTALEQRLFEPPFAQRHFTLHLQLADEHGQATSEEFIISADRQRLREVLDNLLENAVNYSPDGGHIEVTVRPVLSMHEKMVEIRISDTGVGIPPEHLERIFERFHRVDTRLIREVNGLGLGLAICKRIVQLHGGMIRAESTLDQGSAFSILLPL